MYLWCNMGISIFCVKEVSYTVHSRYLFHLQNIRFKLQIPSLIQSFILKNATLIFLNPSTMAGTLQV